MSSQPALTQGSTLAGRYEIGERIGMTPIAESFQAKDNTNATTVVVKVLTPEFSQDTEFVQTYVEQAQAATKLNNSHIASVIDSGTEGATTYVVTEFVAGQPLQKALAEFGKLEPQRAIEIADHVASALTYAHAQGVVHRDLQPSNIMLTQDGQLKVLDFGVARMAHPKTAAQTAAVLGTGAYISPEQARGEEGGKEADVYSLGVILYQMLAGKPPFSGDSPVAVAFQHVRETPSAPNSIGANAPPAVETVLMKMLAKAPADRPPAEEVHTELRRFLSSDTEAAAAAAGAGGTIIAQGVGSPTMVFGPRSGYGGGGGDGNNRKWLIAGVVAAAVLIAIAFFLILRPSTITVPDVTGRQVEAATSQLEGLGLTVETIEHTGAAEADGTVLQQIPGANSAVVKGTTVTLTIAKTITNVTVPNVVGVARSQAEQTLSTAGLTVGAVSEQSASGVTAGSVISQDPAAGTSIDSATPVNLVVAASSSTITVPSVTCVPVNLAATQLAQAGLQMTVAGTEANDLCPATGGPRIARQEPVGDQSVPSGTVIKVWTTLPLPSASPTGGGGGSPKPPASP